MPDWNEVLDELRTSRSTFDIVMRKYIKRLYEHTGRNVIAYYSGWLQKPGILESMINDNDKNGFMTAMHGLDRSKGLDLLIHTPGGGTAATESIVDYLRQMFGTDVRAIIPQLALSAGTMIACSCKSIMMGKQSSLGPIDPQFRGLPAHGVIEEFESAIKECRADPAKIPIWQPIIAKYSPTLIGECQKAIAWSDEMVREWLATGMFSGDADAKEKVRRIVNGLGDHALTKSHDRHISADKCEEIGLKVERMERDQKLQDMILTIHHACIHTLSLTPALKLIENHDGKAYIISVKQTTAAR